MKEPTPFMKFPFSGTALPAFNTLILTGNVGVWAVVVLWEPVTIGTVFDWSVFNNV